MVKKTLLPSFTLQWIWPLLPIALILLWNPIIGSSVTKTCARYSGKLSTRGSVNFTFEYMVGYKKYTLAQGQTFFKSNINLDSLSCIEIEYSNILNFSARVTDDRVLK